MKISLDNPHLKILHQTLIDEGLGKMPSSANGIIARADLLGLTVRNYIETLTAYPLMSRTQQEEVLRLFIVAYNSQKEAFDLVQRLGASSKVYLRKASAW